MEKNNLKNIVVLKDLPSNIVDEAIVILKPNKKIKKLEVMEKSKNGKTIKNDTKSNKYVLKEAEMLLASYISKIDRKQKKKNKYEMLNRKYKMLKKYTVISSLILIISIIINFI